MLISISELLSRFTGKPIVWGYPIWTILEPTNRCNLNCPSCLTGSGSRNDAGGYIDLEKYKKVVDEIAPYGMGVLLYFRGEPLIHPQFNDLVRYAKSKGLIVRTGSNVHSLDTAEKAQKLVESGLDWIRISLDGITQETYTKYRKNGDIDKVKNAIKMIADKKREMHSQMPQILVQFLLFKHTVPQIDQARKLAFSLGADHFFLKTVMVTSDRQAEELLPVEDEYRRYEKTPDGGFVLKGGLHNRCKRLWTYFTVDCSGAVVPCCFDGNKTFLVGNVFESGLKLLWKSKKLTDFRASVLKNRKSIDICKNCTEGIPLYFKK
jgi:radical SAM protein with 4Fe4S-binding SPASM domain